MGKIIPPPGTDPNPPDAIDGKTSALRQIELIKKQLNELEKCLQKMPDWKGRKK
jgi:hypothetical protein